MVRAVCGILAGISLVLAIIFAIITWNPIVILVISFSLVAGTTLVKAFREDSLGKGIITVLLFATAIGIGYISCIFLHTSF